MCVMYRLASIAYGQSAGEPSYQALTFPSVGDWSGGSRRAQSCPARFGAHEAVPSDSQCPLCSRPSTMTENGLSASGAGSVT